MIFTLMFISHLHLTWYKFLTHFQINSTPYLFYSSSLLFLFAGDLTGWLLWGEVMVVGQKRHPKNSGDIFVSQSKDSFGVVWISREEERDLRCIGYCFLPLRLGNQHTHQGLASVWVGRLPRCMLSWLLWPCRYAQFSWEEQYSKIPGNRWKLLILNEGIIFFLY